MSLHALSITPYGATRGYDKPPRALDLWFLRYVNCLRIHFVAGNLMVDIIASEKVRCTLRLCRIKTHNTKMRASRDKLRRQELYYAFAFNHQDLGQDCCT